MTKGLENHGQLTAYLSDADRRRLLAEAQPYLARGAARLPTIRRCPECRAYTGSPAGCCAHCHAMTIIPLDNFSIAGRKLHVEIDRKDGREVTYLLVVEGDPGFVFHSTAPRDRWDCDRKELLAHAIANAALNTARNTLDDAEVYPERNA